MANNVQPNEIVLQFWSKDAKDAFLGGFIDGWGENSCQCEWEGRCKEASHLKVRCFYDPTNEPRDEHHFGDYWHWPGWYTEADKHDALISAEED